MVLTNDLLSWASMTATVNEIKSPRAFLRDLVFSNHQTFPTEQVEIGVLHGDRVLAPMVRRGGPAQVISKGDESFQTVTMPNVRLKMTFEPSELLFNRRPGNTIFVPGADVIASAAEQYMARQLQRMADAITNLEEYMCAQAIRGVISYQVADQENFTVTFGKPAANIITLTNTWDTALGTPSMDFVTAAKVLNEANGLAPTHVLLGSNAMTAFLQNEEVRGNLDLSNFSVGSLGINATGFSEAGALFLGVYEGIQVWAYLASITDPAGAAYPFIRADYAEFISVTPAAENVIYYGAIPDLDALEGRLFQGERFSKSWREKDPSVQYALVHSRPLPVCRRPASSVSMKVT